ncbi:MAG: riboflavin synthase [Acidobacteria bacterium]|nr:riboflavin synthase [Acidobacteriota bacterium]
MFTGLVAGLGRLAHVRRAGAGARARVEHELPGGNLEPGESICVDGCCLTVAGLGPGWFEADLSPETLARTGGTVRWRPGRSVNLERALRAEDRVGGHYVQGHVDGTLRLTALRRQPGGWIAARVELPPRARRYVVEKGSIALDGVSLTVARTGRGWFEVALIPATLGATTLSRRRPGSRLIVEYDVLAKYSEVR